MDEPHVSPAFEKKKKTANKTELRAFSGTAPDLCADFS